jgi:hypothetical protein
VWLPARTRHQLVCCSCQFAHDLRFDTFGAGIHLTMWANKKATAKERAKARRKK